MDTDGDIVDDLWRYAVFNSLQQVNGPNLDQVTYTHAKFTGGSERIDDGSGSLLKASYLLWATNSIFIALDISFTTAFTNL